MSRLEVAKEFGKATVASLVTTTLVAYENRNTALENYDQAIVARGLSTFVFTYIFLNIHKKIKNVLPAGVFNKPASITLTSSLVAATTYSVQLVFEDPEAIEAAKWAFCLGVGAFTFEDYKDSVASAIKKIVG